MNGLRRPHYVVDPIGTQCAEVAGHIAKSPHCEGDALRYRAACCGAAEPDPIPQMPTKAPGSNIQNNGPYKTCSICRNGNYPSKISVINILYSGLDAGSCTQYFEAGLLGLIPTQLCDTLQFFAFEPCGCDGTRAAEAPEQDTPNKPPTMAPNAIQTRKPTADDQRQKLSGNYGGAGGGQQHGGRRLKGSR